MTYISRDSNPTRNPRMNRLSKSLFALIAGMVLAGCSSSSTAPKSSGSSSVNGLSSSVAGGSSIAGVRSSSSTALASSSGTHEISYGTLTDSRDSQAYKTVAIGTQTWMAANLNYKPTVAPDSSWCYNNAESNCATYGRLYDYPTALTVCPTGWHLPDTTEWNTLEAYAGSASKLEANSSLWILSSGTDDYGFSGLPSGGYDVSSFYDLGDHGYWWTATASGSDFADNRGLFVLTSNIDHFDVYQTDGLAVRCVKNP